MAKESRTMNFLKHNLFNTSGQVKESAYLMMVWPQLEYTSHLWDPYHVGKYCGTTNDTTKSSMLGDEWLW